MLLVLLRVNFFIYNPLFGVRLRLLLMRVTFGIEMPHAICL